jgi:Tfp pilus assembly protein PilF
MDTVPCRYKYASYKKLTNLLCLHLHELYFSKRGQRQRGQALIDRVLDLDPDNVDAMIVKGWVTMTEGHWAVAQQYYERALQRDPRNAETLYYYGKFWHQRGELSLKKPGLN